LRLCFGECVFDTGLRVLTRGGRPAPLSPKAFRLLEVLAERRPSAVPAAELRRLLWPEAMVGGTTLARLVNEVRAALGDRARPPRFIRTVQRFGYAFDGPVEESAPATVHRGYAVQWGIRQVPLAAGENVIGRSPDALISVASSKVSRRHARILVEAGGATLEDLDSKNGTYLGGTRIESPVGLRHGDRITVGPVVLVFRVSSAEETTSDATRP
jgi:DNA-binding winged helix-turn-helix (wHTH) protein